MVAVGLFVAAGESPSLEPAAFDNPSSMEIALEDKRSLEQERTS
ncbi:hypothetical protein [Natronolimnobius sp. AArcel1]|nr:hypothetical protein [Natronolimnobius sp. AArcel1]